MLADMVQVAYDVNPQSTQETTGLFAAEHDGKSKRGFCCER